MRVVLSQLLNVFRLRVCSSQPEACAAAAGTAAAQPHDSVYFGRTTVWVDEFALLQLVSAEEAV